MTNKTITLTEEEFDLFVQLMYVITSEDEEVKDLIQECNDLIDRVS